MFEDSKDDQYLSTFRSIELKVTDDMSPEEAVRRFRTMVTRERIMSDLKEHQRYEKPSEKKRRKRRETKVRTRKAENLLKALISGKKDG